VTRRTRSAGWTDEQFDEVLAHVLRGGVLLSATVVACGGVVFLARHGIERPEYHLFRGEPDALRTIGGILSEATRLSGRGLIQLGLLLLIATPISRVVFSVIGFARQRDWLYVLITLTVLTLLTCSLASG
jgi:uncharacterized membrane protein